MAKDKELDTSWFDLKNYEALKTMSIEDWTLMLYSRYYYYDAEQDRKYFSELSLSEMVDELKSVVKPLVRFNDVVDTWVNDWTEDILENYSFSTSSVNSLTNLKLWFMTLGNRFYELQNNSLKPQGDDTGASNDNLLEIGRIPYDLDFKKQHNYFPSEAHLAIKLSATDEQLKKDFDHWLTNYRKTTDYRVPKKKKIHEQLFTQKVFDYWIEFGIFPYLDLMLIAKIEGKTIGHGKMADLIFPNPIGFTAIGRLRDTTIPEAKRLIKSEIHESMIIQLVSEKANRMKRHQKSS